MAGTSLIYGSVTDATDSPLRNAIMSLIGTDKTIILTRILMQTDFICSKSLTEARKKKRYKTKKTTVELEEL